MDKIDGSVSGAAIESPDGQAQIADAVQQTTGFTPAAEPHNEKHQPLREDHIQNAVAFLAHPKVLILCSMQTVVSCPNLVVSLSPPHILCMTIDDATVAGICATETFVETAHMHACCWPLSTLMTADDSSTMQVRGSPVESKQSFLEKKGLTPDEIAEAFKRVPQTPSASTAAAATGTGMCRLLGQNCPLVFMGVF